MEKNRFSPELKEDEGSVKVGEVEYFFQLVQDEVNVVINWFNKPKNHLEVEKKIKEQLKKKDGKT